MGDPTDKVTKHIKDRSTGTEGYLEYTNENKKAKINLMWGTRKTSTIITKTGREKATVSKTTEYCSETKTETSKRVTTSD